MATMKLWQSSKPQTGPGLFAEHTRKEANMPNRETTVRANLLRNAQAMVEKPWLYTRSDLKRAQTILNNAGLKNLAASVQPFIDNPIKAGK